MSPSQAPSNAGANRNRDFSFIKSFELESFHSFSFNIVRLGISIRNAGSEWRREFAMCDDFCDCYFYYRAINGRYIHDWFLFLIIIKIAEYLNGMVFEFVKTASSCCDIAHLIIVFFANRLPLNVDNFFLLLFVYVVDVHLWRSDVTARGQQIIYLYILSFGSAWWLPMQRLYGSITSDKTWSL